MSLFRTSLLSALSVLVRLGSALAINKLLAVYVGPAGYALIGQLQSLTSMAAGIAGGALSSGVIKSTAEHFDDRERQRACWRTAFRVSLLTTMAAVISLLLLRQPLSTWLFSRDDLSEALTWLALALPATGANLLFLAMLNGKKDIGVFATASIAGNLLAFGTIVVLTLSLGMRGALIGAAIGPGAGILATAVLISRAPWFRVQDLWGPVDSSSFRQLSKIALMMLTTAVCTPVAQVLIRNHLGGEFGWTAAGQWQAVTKISEIYLMFIALTLGTYYLPRIAEIREMGELRAEVAKVYRFALPMAAGAAVAIYIWRDLLVLLLFTADFAPMTDLFAWQLSGDVVKVASWVLGYVLIGRAATVAFIGTEVFFSALLVALTWTLTEHLGLKGAPAAYFVNYVLYLATMIFLVRWLMRQGG